MQKPKKNELNGREIIIVMFLGMMTIMIFFLFVKRQIIRFTLKNRRGPHYPIGANAPKFLKKEIERRLALTKEIKTEPLLISGENQFNEFRSTNEVPTQHYYRMKAIDELKKLEELIVNVGGDKAKRKVNHDLRDHLMSLTNDNQILNKCDPEILNQFVDLYLHARHQSSPVFDKKFFNEYMIIIQKLQKFITKKLYIPTNFILKTDEKVLNKAQSIKKSPLIGSDENLKETCV